MDIDKLLKALDKDSNEGLLNMTSAKIKQLNSSVLSELQLSRDYPFLIVQRQPCTPLIVLTP